MYSLLEIILYRTEERGCSCLPVGGGQYFAEVGSSATCSAMRISATCATRKFAADVRFNPQAADYGIAPAH
jgi:hypothetical protein